MKPSFLQSLLLSALVSSTALADENSTMWYDKPADGYGLKSPTLPWKVENQKRTDKRNPDPVWERYALPIGNGFIGAMLYGNVETDRIQFNEHSLWSGGPGSEGWKVNDNKMDAGKFLPEIRKALIAGDRKKAQNLSTEHLRGEGSSDRDQADKNFGRYQTFGEIFIHTGHKEFSKYHRQLDLSKGLSTVSYESGGVAYQRSYFCSNPDRCLVFSYSADKPGQQNLSLSIQSPHMVGFSEKDGVYIISGKVKNNGLLIEAQVGVNLDGGTVAISDKGIEVIGANQATFILVAGTNYAQVYPTYRGENPNKKNTQLLTNALKLGYETLKKNHVADHQNLHGRVAIDLGTTAPDIAKLPTDRRLALNKKTPDHDLEELYFQFGRYLLIGSSREGGLPANLQGIWCNEQVPAWRSDYHLNINLQMNYWPAGPCNLLECQKPLISYAHSLIKPGSLTAKAYANADGWAAHLASNIWGTTAPNPGKDRPRYWAYFPLGGSWLATHSWEQYSFDLDKDYLKKNSWPVLAGSADYICDLMYKLPNGELSSTPSWSPEHGPISLGATCDIAMAREALTAAIKAAEVLGEKGARIDKWIKTLNGLAKYKIGRYGQLQEWHEDIDNPKDNHRHINHLFGTYPGHQINLTDTPKLAAASKKVMVQRGYGIYGWSIGWQINLSARLQDSERCYEVFRNLMVKPTKPNFFNVTQAFQIDGNFGGTSGVAEMLVQSRIDKDNDKTVIDLIPTLPKEWHTGSVKGLLARGGVTVDIVWKDGSLVSAKLLSQKDCTAVVKFGKKQQTLQLKSGVATSISQ